MRKTSCPKGQYDSETYDYEANPFSQDKWALSSKTKAMHIMLNNAKKLPGKGKKFFYFFSPIFFYKKG